MKTPSALDAALVELLSQNLALDILQSLARVFVTLGEPALAKELEGLVARSYYVPRNP